MHQSLLQQSTPTTWCCHPRASRLGGCSSICNPPPFSSEHNDDHYGQTVLFLFQTRGHFSKKYNLCPHVQLQTVVWLFYADFGAGASSLLSGLSGYVDILKQHLKTSVRKLKLGLPNGQWPQDGLKTKSRFCSSHQSPDLNPINLWAELKKHVCHKEAYNPDSVTPALSGGMAQNSSNLLWNATLNVWPKLNNLKAMLLNTNWVYVNF